MEETQAASSTAEVDVFQGQQPSVAEYDSYRRTGELPERFKPAEPAESAPADSPEETAEPDAPDSDPEEAQELPQKVSPAEKRIKQLLAENKELKRKQEAAAKQTESGSSPAQAQPRAPQNYDEWRATFKPSEFVSKYAEQNPDATYEDAQAAMFEHLSKAEKHFTQLTERQQANFRKLQDEVNATREKYEDFDHIKDTFVGQIMDDKGNSLIPSEVFKFVNKSKVLTDLIYTIGSDEKATADFVQMAKNDPEEAMRYVARVEIGIAEELAKGKESTPRGEDGKFKAPERKQTQAPKPPSPVSGGTSRAFDVSDESLTPEQWMQKRNKSLGIG